MQYRKLGNTDLEVSTISLGSWVFGGECWGEVNDAESIRVIEEAIEKGINFIDTAPIYGDGRAEEIIGRAVKSRSSKTFIATKCGLEKKGHSIRPNLSADFIRKEVENSLRRLKIETIDLYQCHWPDPNTSLKETFGELKNLAAEGKIRHIGVSNFDNKFLERASTIEPIVSNQVQYSLFDRKIEKDLIPFCRDKGISILSYGSLGGGILTGKYKNPPELSRGDVKSFFYKFYEKSSWDKTNAFIDALREIAKTREVPVSHVAINWVLSHQEVASSIAGCRTLKQLNENIKAVDWNLSEEELAKIETCKYVPVV